MQVGGSMGLFYGYVGVVGLVLWGILRYLKAGVSLAHVWCTYGEAGAGSKGPSGTCAWRVVYAGEPEGRHSSLSRAAPGKGLPE